MRKLLAAVGLLAIGALPAIAGGGSAHWGYTGKVGPEFWGDLAPEYRACKEGKNQSPIDLNPDVFVKACLEPLKVSYSKGATSVLNNGHTIKVKVKGDNFVEVDGKKFYLKQFHFHAPSEHTVNGKNLPFEAHFVNLDDEGNITVLGVFFKVGRENPELAKIWSVMPERVGGETKIKEQVDINALLPKSRDYYRYSGSLTTPPCTEGVRWIVFKEPMELSKEQLEKFRKVMGVNNNRPTQPINARKVLK